MNEELRMYPVSYALALIEVRDALFSATEKVLSLPDTPVDSVEYQAMKNQLAHLLMALEKRGIYNPLMEA